MKLYNDIFKMPINKLDQIQRSFIDEKPDLTPLIIEGKYKKRHKEKLLSQYNELLYQFPKLDNELNVNWLLYYNSMQAYKVDLLNNELRVSEGFEPILIDKYPANKAFRNYLNSLVKNYDEFEFNINFLHPKFREIYIKTTGEDIPEDFNLNLEFFLAEEFVYYLMEFDDKFRLSVAAGYITYIKSEVRTFSQETYSIEKINERLEKQFRAIGQYDKWFNIRVDYFDLQRLNFRAKNENTILSDVIDINSILNQDIDIDKITVGQLLTTYAKKASEVIKNNGRK